MSEPQMTTECNIWREGEDNEDNITFEENRESCTLLSSIQTITLNKLIEKLTQPNSDNFKVEEEEELWLFTAKMYTTFTTDEKLYTKLTERFVVPKSFIEFEREIQLKVIKFMELWLETSCFCQSENLRKLISSFVTKNSSLFNDSESFLLYLSDPSKYQPKGRIVLSRQKSFDSSIEIASNSSVSTDDNNNNNNNNNSNSNINEVPKLRESGSKSGITQLLTSSGNLIRPLQELGFLKQKRKSSLPATVSNNNNNNNGNINNERPTPMIPKASPPYVFSDIHEVELARQLTIQSFSIYKKIEWSEFLNVAWSKEKLKDQAKNLLEMIHNYNYVSSWVATALVIIPKLKERTKLFSQLVAIAEQLRSLNNYHLVSAFVSAFNKAPILRLQHTRSKLPKRDQTILAELEALVSMDSSFASYRSALENSSSPCIPFIGCHLNDLIFIEENSSMIGNRINLFKYRSVYSVIQHVLKYQNVGYNLEEIDTIQQFIKSLKSYNEKNLYKYSLQIEPRNSDKEDLL